MANCNRILLNIWEDLQPTALEALRDEQLLVWIAKVPVLPRWTNNEANQTARFEECVDRSTFI